MPERDLSALHGEIAAREADLVALTRDLAHQPDEYVRIDDPVNAARVMATAAWSLLDPV
jgi:acetylornithine deacetylase/succinyl-diaminopimelate desuccinylase-like protein